MKTHAKLMQLAKLIFKFDQRLRLSNQQNSLHNTFNIFLIMNMKNISKLSERTKYYKEEIQILSFGAPK